MRTNRIVAPRIDLTEAQVKRALPKIAEGLHLYLGIQRGVRSGDVSRDLDFQRRFNRFYRVRRAEEWRRAYFALFENEKGRRPTLRRVIERLHAKTGRVEASFASKLVATLDPKAPVIDSIVLRNLKVRLPLTKDVTGRIEGVVALHQAMAATYSRFLESRTGRLLVARFRKAYPSAGITEIKMLDFILWQTRGAKLRWPATRR